MNRLRQWWREAQFCKRLAGIKWLKCNCGKEHSVLSIFQTMTDKDLLILCDYYAGTEDTQDEEFEPDFDPDESYPDDKLHMAGVP